MLLSENWKKICREEMQEEILANRMEGQEEGLEKGRKEGQEVLKKILKQLLAKQAPHSMKAYQSIIENAELSDLQAWLEIALNEGSLETVFGYASLES